MTDQQPDLARSRREGRERALELAYEAQVRSWSVARLLDAQTLPPDPFVVELLERGEARRAEADHLIEATSTRWSMSRMAVLDVVIMRLAVAELLADETPHGVVLAEAVELAGRYSTEESSKFVNGILAAIASGLQDGSLSPD
ncbi:MAG: transcription antitermination factor NusB [Actinomycetota bacterium]